MKILRCNVGLGLLLILAGSGFQPVCAELPLITKKPWLGYFAGFANNRYQFGVSAQGEITLTPLNDKGDPVAKSLVIEISPVIEEVKPDGTVTIKRLRPDSLESAQEKTEKLEMIVVRGKVTGDAAFEVTISQDRGIISMGGRMTDPGTQAKFPLRFVIRTKFPDAYLRVKKGTKKEIETFETRIEDDRLELKWSDGKRKKLSLIESMDASSKEINGSGINDLVAEFSSYKGKKIHFFSSPECAMTLSNAKKAPLHEGFEIHWMPDPAKDAQGKARLSFEVK
jgi:hypothetical protein